MLLSRRLGGGGGGGGSGTGSGNGCGGDGWNINELLSRGTSALLVVFVGVDGVGESG